MCDHLHETTSRYEAAAKMLTLLLVCQTCSTEMADYEPRPIWTPSASAPAVAAPRLFVLSVESSIAPEVTLDQWRNRKRARSQGARGTFRNAPSPGLAGIYLALAGLTSEMSQEQRRSTALLPSSVPQNSQIASPSR